MCYKNSSILTNRLGMSLEYVNYIDKSPKTPIDNYTIKRIHIELQFARLKQIQKFQKYIREYTNEALEATFKLVGIFLMNECLDATGENIIELEAMVDFFNYETYYNTTNWWSELYAKHMMNEYLEKIMTLCMK